MLSYQIIVVNNFEEFSDSVESDFFSGTWMRKTEYLIQFLVWRQRKTLGQVNFCICFRKDAESDSHPLDLDVSIV